MNYIFTLIGIVVFLNQSLSQLNCDSNKVGKLNVHWCYDSEIRPINPDSLAKAHWKLKKDAYYIIIPNDSLVKLKTIILTSNKIFSGKNSTILESISQSKNRRAFIFMNRDYSTELVKYKDTIKQGKYAHYYFPYLLKEIGRFKNGLKTGRWLSWDSTGNLIEVKFYKNGFEKKYISGKKLKSLRFTRFGFCFRAGTLHVNSIGLNRAIQQESILHQSFEPGNLMISGGIQIGNPSSLTLDLNFKSFNNKSINDYGLFGTSKGGMLNYTFLQFKSMNYRFGTGIEFPELIFTNFVQAYPTPNGPILSNNIIVVRDKYKTIK